MPTPPPSPTLPLLQRRTMRVLVVAQLLGALGLAAGGTAGALLAEHLTGSAAAAGNPRRGPRRAGHGAAAAAGGSGAGLLLAGGRRGGIPPTRSGSITQPTVKVIPD